MKLRSVDCRDYKSIRNSNCFEISDVTCLVGKNESGKTALLEALYRLNPIIPKEGKFDVTDDYPRSDVADYEQSVNRGKREHSVVIQAAFDLQDDDTAEVQDAFGDVFTSRALVLSKGYDNKLNIEMKLDESAAVKTLVGKAQLPDDVAKEASKCSTLNDLAEFLEEKSQEQAEAVKDAQRKANALEDPEEKAKALDQANRFAESKAR